jgi:hypothetical protein
MVEPRRNFLLFFLFLLSACTSTYSPKLVNIKNNLSGCVKLLKHSEQVKDGMVWSRVTFYKAKIIANCGCTSKIGSYTSYVIDDECETWLASGKVLFDDGETINLTLATDYRLIGNRPIGFELSCEP